MDRPSQRLRQAERHREYMTIWNTIKSEKEFNKAVERLDELIDITEDDPRWNERTLLSYLIEEYEDMIEPIPDATPLEVIRYVMELRGMKQKDLEGVLGSKGQVSRVLSGKRKLTVDKVHPLARLLNIPALSLLPKPADSVR